MYHRGLAQGTIVVFVDIQQILLPQQKAFCLFTWDNKEAYFSQHCPGGRIGWKEHTHTKKPTPFDKSSPL